MTRQILIVDDETIICLAFKKMLEMTLPFPCRVDTAHCGEDALVKARAVPPHLVLLDIRMPGMCGFEVCRDLKADPRTAGAIVVYASGNEAPPDSLEGGDAYLVKPVPLTVLRETVTRLLGKPLQTMR